jgi:iron(III) transport system ATP-binding protein
VLAASEAALKPGASATLSIRPENVELSERPSAADEGGHVCAGTVEAKVFQGDFTDFQIRVGDVLLLARAHPSLRTPVGDPVHIRIAPDKCVVLAEEGGGQ